MVESVEAELMSAKIRDLFLSFLVLAVFHGQLVLSNPRAWIEISVDTLDSVAVLFLLRLVLE